MAFVDPYRHRADRLATCRRQRIAIACVNRLLWPHRRKDARFALAMTLWVAKTNLSLLIVLASACAENATGICDQTVVDYCTNDANVCPAVWTQAQDPKAWGCRGRLVLEQCGHATVATVFGIDSGWHYIYGADGKLVGISAYNLGRTTCVAGIVPESDCVDPSPKYIDLCDRD